MRTTPALAFALVFASALPAADIHGTLIVNRKLTRRNVTLSAGIYQRGMAVPVAPDAVEDPLAFERAHVAVWLEGDGPTTQTTAEMAQHERRFSPDFLVIPAGSTVSFPNGDAVFHNVFSLSKPCHFDLGNYPRGDTRFVTFDRPGIVFVNCRLHPNMAAVIVVTPNRWCAAGDASGRFTLRDVPNGRYRIVAWHKAAGYYRREVNVAAGADASVEFVIPISDSTGGHEVASR